VNCLDLTFPSNAKDVETSQSLSMFASGSSKRSIAQSVIHAETLFQGFVTEHNLPLAINDHFSKLTRRMFPDSEIAKQYSCARTKSLSWYTCRVSFYYENRGIN